MRNKVNVTLAVCCVCVIFVSTGCQKLGLWKYGIGEQEIPYINEEHRKACEQPTGPRLSKDRCGRLKYPDGSTH